MNITLIKVIRSLSLTGFVFGLAGWIYIALIALVHPQTLSWQLSHLTPWIREDTFGFLSFAISIVSFFVYNLVKE